MFSCYCIENRNAFCPASPFWSNQHETPDELTDDAVAQPVKERACETLALCILTTLNKGLRNGGGIGDVLRRPSVEVSRKPDVLL